MLLVGNDRSVDYEHVECPAAVYVVLVSFARKHQRFTATVTRDRKFENLKHTLIIMSALMNMKTE